MRSLTISSWNIQGLYSSHFGYKTTNPELIKNIKGQDIIILLETWCRGDIDTQCPSGYRESLLPSIKHKNVKRGRDSGGIIIWHKQDLALNEMKKGTTHIWLKLNKGTIYCDNDVYICAAYAPPSDSSYYDDQFFDNLQTEIITFQAQGKVLLCGDFNARTGSEPDYTDAGGNHHIFGHPSLYSSPIINNRNSPDQILNKNGKELVHLCRALGLYMLNGRIRGDSLGQFTYCSALGTSVVDYAITDIDPSSISAFTVRPQTPLSDHSQINVFLKKLTGNIHSKKQPNKLYNINQSFRWAPNSAEAFIETLNSNEMMNSIQFFNNSQYQNNKDGVNSATQNINCIFQKAASKANLRKPKQCNIRSKNQNVSDKWFDNECKTIRKHLRQMSNKKHKQQNNPELRYEYFETLKQYKQTLKCKKLNYTNKTLDEIENAIDQNQFWDMWNNLSTTKPQELAIQDVGIWKTYFDNLYKNIPQKDLNQNQLEIKEKLNILESVIKNNQNPLDYPITQQELNEKLKSIKSKKACGVDNIRNEMLKNSTPELQNAVLKLFNMVLTSGCFPDVWNQGLISPIHKSGDKSDPNNYRGICVNSNLGKIFCSILNSRIQTFLQEKNVISKCQIGFLPNHRTTDHIYTLHTLINKHVHQKKEGKIFACFIDFKKAFDSIWHEGLFYKILQSGLGGKVYDLIKCMYTENKCAIKIKNQRTEFFSQCRGVRQGCNLSPNLFNIYINELADMLDQSPAPGLTLFDTEVKYLLYADDLVLLSPTKEGLQQNINILEQYCHNWALAVNFQKTKIMIFQKKPRCQKHKCKFTLNNTLIEHTKNYTYLGLTISASGNFNMAVKALKEKARRAMYAIKMKLFKINIPIRIWTKIFDSVILPIALYGSEVWGPLNKLDFKMWDKHPIEALHAEFCRKILQVQRNTPTNACRAELGRFPVIMKIQKRSLKFWLHLNSSPNSSLQFKALQAQELSPETSPLSQLVLDLTNQADTSTASKERIPINKIMNQSKESYLQYWKNETKSQSRLNCYLTLNREYELADYLYSVRDTKQRQILTKYRLSDHRLAIETGRHKKTWLPKEERVCGHCMTGEVETEMHFLLYCDKYSSQRDSLFTEMTTYIPNFYKLNPEEKLRILMGEGAMAPLAAKYVFSCHSLRDTE